MGWNHQLGRFGAIFLKGLFSLNQLFRNYGCQLPIQNLLIFEVWTFMSNGFRLSHELEGMTKNRNHDLVTMEPKHLLSWIS